MNYQIRCGIHETSSSSANAFAMISERGRRNDIKLDKTWICVNGCYETAWDGAPHVYLNSWADKMAFLADDSPVWHKMFKKVTGQDFVMYRLFNVDFEHEGEVDPHTIPNAIVIENRGEEDYVQVVPDLEYVCAVNLNYREGLVALPENTPEEFLKKYHLEQTYGAIESYVSMRDLEEMFGDDEVDGRLLEEIIFNPAIAFNIGGDAYCDDNGCGLISGNIWDKSADKTFRRVPYSLLDTVYRNGNETLILGFDGTKVRMCRGKTSEPVFPESIDVKITDRCEHNCPFCYEGCTENGLDGEIPEKLFASLPPFTELAIGGGNPTLHPDLFSLPKKYNVHMNLTLHADDFCGLCTYEYNPNMGWQLTGSEKQLLQFDAVGVSVSSSASAGWLAYYLNKDEDCYPEHWGYRIHAHSGWYSRWKDTREEAKKEWETYSQIVIHAVNGVICEGMLDELFDKNLDLLILGYKTKGRGVEFAENGKVAENQKWLYDNIQSLAEHFRVVAFDNLALEQLNVRRFISDEDWKHFYMGDEGTHSMYIDLVKKEYGISSTDNRRWRLTDDIKEMFRHVREVAAQDKIISLDNSENL